MRHWFAPRLDMAFSQISNKLRPNPMDCKATLTESENWSCEIQVTLTTTFGFREIQVILTATCENALMQQEWLHEH